MTEDFIQKVIGEFRKEFTFASFTWNGNSFTGETEARKTRKRMQSFLTQKLEESYLEGLDEGARNWAKQCGKEQSCSMCLERLGRVKRLTQEKEENE